MAPGLPERTVVVPLPANTPRGRLRLVCARIHDVAAVTAVEVDADRFIDLLTSRIGSLA